MAVGGVLRACEQIEHHIGKISQQKQLGRITEITKEALIALGVHAEDVKGMHEMYQSVVSVTDRSIYWLPAYSNPGIFFIYKIRDDAETPFVLAKIHEGMKRKNPYERLNPIAIFKIGAKRAATELQVRKLALLLGLEDYACPGVFFSKSDLDLTVWDGLDGVVETLWCGAEKKYITTSKDEDEECEKEEEPRVVGILEPIASDIAEGAEKRKEELLYLTLLALAIGLRDGHKENVLKRLIDTEESFGSRLDPPAHERFTTPATHLPYLSDPVCSERIGATNLAGIKNLVSKWDLEKVCAFASKEPIFFFDGIFELMDPSEMKDESGSPIEFVDENYHLAEGSFEEDEIDDLFPPKPLDGRNLVFSQNQIETLKLRLERIREAVLSATAESVILDFVKAVDPFYIRTVQVIKTISPFVKGSQMLRSISTEPYNSAGRQRASPGLLTPTQIEFEGLLATLEGSATKELFASYLQP